MNVSFYAKYTQKKYLVTFSVKKGLSRQYKHVLKKKGKLAFLKRGYSMILVKKLKFFHVLFLSKIDGEKVFTDVLDKKEAFKNYKNNSDKKRKIRIFPNGLVHRFAKKFKISLTFIFKQNTPRKSIWERSSKKKVSIILCNPL